MTIYQKIKAEVKRIRSNTKYLNNTVIDLILEAQETGNYNEVYKTKLYKFNSPVYCSLLEIINQKEKAL